MAKLVGYAQEFDQQKGEDFDTYYKRTDDLFDKLYEQQSKLPAGQIQGRFISFPIADGKAWYCVKRTKPLELIHIPVGDAYRIPPAHIRGLTLSDIKSMVKCEQSLMKLFKAGTK